MLFPEVSQEAKSSIEDEIEQPHFQINRMIQISI